MKNIPYDTRADHTGGRSHCMKKSLMSNCLKLSHITILRDLHNLIKLNDRQKEWKIRGSILDPVTKGDQTDKQWNVFFLSKNVSLTSL